MTDKICWIGPEIARTEATCLKLEVCIVPNLVGAFVGQVVERAAIVRLEVREVPVLPLARFLILLMIENFRSGLIWNIMRRSPFVIAGLKRAGFQGGWLDG